MTKGGADEAKWDGRCRDYVFDDSAARGTVCLRVGLDSLVAKELSYSVRELLSPRA